MDEAAGNVADETKKPEDKQNYKDSPEHISIIDSNFAANLRLLGLTACKPYLP
jgi:hypothetical protein